MKPIDGHAMIKRVEELYRKGAVDLSYFNIVREAVQMEPTLHIEGVAEKEVMMDDIRLCPCQQPRPERGASDDRHAGVWRG